MILYIAIALWVGADPSSSAGVQERTVEQQMEESDEAPRKEAPQFEVAPTEPSEDSESSADGSSPRK